MGRCWVSVGRRGLGLVVKSPLLGFGQSLPKGGRRGKDMLLKQGIEISRYQNLNVE